MNPIKIVEKTPTSIFYELPAGKPDPNQPRPDGGVDTRDRVIQQAQKGSTCWYYSINRLRKRIGKSAGSEWKKERQIELAGSLWRKQETAVHQSLPALTDFFGIEVSKKTFTSIDRNEAEERLKTKDAFTEYGGRPSLSVLLTEFLQENKYQNLQEFLEEKISNKYIEIQKELIKNLGGSPNEVDNCLQMFDNKSYDAIGFINHLGRIRLAEAYQLKVTQWTPLKNIESLIQELTLHGPLAVEGFFGKDCYIDEPIKEIVKEREIYSWKPGSQRRPTGGHVVVIVGAKKVKDCALVYFIDPTEKSDPQNPASQRCYKISYNNLTTHVRDSLGLVNKNQAGTGDVGYGYHGHFNI